MNIIDAAVARALRMKFEPGLFKQPYVDPGSAKAANGSAEHRAREAVGDSVGLLKNDRHVLPLLKGKEGTLRFSAAEDGARRIWKEDRNAPLGVTAFCRHGMSPLSRLLRAGLPRSVGCWLHLMKMRLGGVWYI